MNDIIVHRIKEARLERGLTQQVIADHLGRTAAAVSEMERGKVQVNASDLYTIALLLNKPIEYFFGEDYSGKEIEEIITAVRKQSPEIYEQSIEMTKLHIQILELGNTLNDNDAELTIEQMKSFYDIFIPYSIMINNLTDKLNDLRKNLESELEIRGIQIYDLKEEN
jgi:transcriptional regulator with XRE-family HTH domain